MPTHTTFVALPHVYRQRCLLTRPSLRFPACTDSDAREPGRERGGGEHQGLRPALQGRLASGCREHLLQDRHALRCVCTITHTIKPARSSARCTIDTYVITDTLFGALHHLHLTCSSVRCTFEKPKALFGSQFYSLRLSLCTRPHFCFPLLWSNRHVDIFPGFDDAYPLRYLCVRRVADRGCCTQSMMCEFNTNEVPESDIFLVGFSHGSQLFRWVGPHGKAFI